MPVVILLIAQVLNASVDSPADTINQESLVAPSLGRRGWQSDREAREAGGAGSEEFAAGKSFAQMFGNQPGIHGICSAPTKSHDPLSAFVLHRAIWFVNGIAMRALNLKRWFSGL
jgi:hypothetical protein